MKKAFILFIFIQTFFHCSEITYKHESNIDYDKYSNCFVHPINGDVFFHDSDHQYLVNNFIDNLSEKSGFDAIYNGMKVPEMIDSSDCRISINIDETEKEEEVDSEGRNINMKVKISIIFYDNADRAVMRFTKKENEEDRIGEYASSDEINGLIYALTRKAVKDALNKASSEFLKSLEI